MLCSREILYCGWRFWLVLFSRWLYVFPLTIRNIVRTESEAAKVRRFHVNTWRERCIDTSLKQIWYAIWFCFHNQCNDTGFGALVTITTCSVSLFAKSILSRVNKIIFSFCANVSKPQADLSGICRTLHTHLCFACRHYPPSIVSDNSDIFKGSVCATQTFYTRVLSKSATNMRQMPIFLLCFDASNMNGHTHLNQSTEKKEITKTSTHSATWARVLAYYCLITVDSVSTKIHPKKVQFSISNLDDENTQRSRHLDNSILVPILISRISTYLQLISVSKNRLACVTNSRVQF